MKRTLILIANAGTPSNLAEGVYKDICDYKNFFFSDNGGAWDESETLSFSSRQETALSKALLNKVILDQRNAGSEYFLIVFCGHGYATQSQETVFELSPNNNCTLSDLKKMLQGVRFTLIADSCRGVVSLHEGGKIATRRMFSQIKKDSSYRKLCRYFYDDVIQRASWGAHTICFSAGFGETASDLGPLRGGLFSQKLLDSIHQDLLTLAKSVETDGKYCEYQDLSTYVAEAYQSVIRVSGNKQHPVCICKGGKDELPFVICPNWQLQIPV